MTKSLTLGFKSLTDPKRREILRLLQEDDLTAGEIAEHFNITKPSISHHLNLLKQAGLVEGRRDGQNIIYSLNTTVLQDLMRWFFEFTPESKNGPQKIGDDDEEI